MIYDPLLKARKETLLDLSEDLSDEEYVIAEKAVDVFLDKLDYELEHAEKMVRDHETGQIRIIIKE